MPRRCSGCTCAQRPRLTEDFELFPSDVLWVERRRAVHSDEREQLQKMRLQYVTYDARAVEIRGAALLVGARGLFEDDLDVRDVVSVPDGRQKAIRESHHLVARNAAIRMRGPPRVQRWLPNGAKSADSGRESVLKETQIKRRRRPLAPGGSRQSLSRGIYLCGTGSPVGRKDRDEIKASEAKEEEGVRPAKGEREKNEAKRVGVIH